MIGGRCMDNLQKYRFSIFVILFIVLFTCQFLFPRRKFIKKRWKYVLSNFTLAALNNISIILLVLIPIRAGFLVEKHDIGLLSLGEMPFIFRVIASVILLDIIVYFQHRVFHKVSFLWKLHSVHHIDPMLDTSSGLRFHPLEIIISNIIKILSIFIIGIPALAILIFEIILNSTAMFNHSNIKIPNSVEIILRLVLVTPDLHLIHHSVIVRETNSNYGFSVVFWDKLFGTYVDQPKYDYSIMEIGTAKKTDEKQILFPGMIMYPFKSK